MNKAFEKIINRLIIIRDKYSKDTTYGKHHISAYNKALKIVQEVAEEYNNGWIPCSERLPENIFTVIIQVKEMKNPTFGWYENITGWILTEQELELKDFTVIAWQPLPEPYKESD